jgi:hypothetical protein
VRATNFRGSRGFVGPQIQRLKVLASAFSMAVMETVAGGGVPATLKLAITADFTAASLSPRFSFLQDTIQVCGKFTVSLFHRRSHIFHYAGGRARLGFSLATQHFRRGLAHQPFDELGVGYSSEMEQTPADETYLQQHRRSFGSRPIRVLTSGNHAVGHLETKPPDTPEHLKYEQETTLAQARWLTLSSNSKQIFAHNSSEYIQFDEPETMINAVREVYDQARRSVEQGR